MVEDCITLLGSRLFYACRCIKSGIRLCAHCEGFLLIGSFILVIGCVISPSLGILPRTFSCFLVLCICLRIRLHLLLFFSRFCIFIRKMMLSGFQPYLLVFFIHQFVNFLLLVINYHLLLRFLILIIFSTNFCLL